MVENTRSWKEVPLKYSTEWMNAFDKSKEGMTLTIECPICNCKKLHRYYHMNDNRPRTIDGNNFIGVGDLWEWCSSCYHFSRYSAAIPEWWNCDLEVNLSNIHHTPEFLEIAIQ